MTKLGRIAGLQLRAHYSFLFAFGAMISVIAFGYLPIVTPASTAAQRVAVGSILTLLFSASIVVHEVAHAVVARLRGQKVTAVTLYLFGGAAHIETRNMRPIDEILVAAAGPLASALLAAIFLGSGAAVVGSHFQAAVLLMNLGLANALLAAFNLLPGLPMDGGRVLRGILEQRSGNAISATRRATSCGRTIAYIGVAFGALVAVRGDVVPGIWLAVLGWFLAGLAQSYYRAVVVRIALEGLRARDLCARELPALQTADTVFEAQRHFGVGASSRVLPVLFGERPAGIAIDVEIARRVLAGGGEATVGAVMTRVADMPVLDGEDEATALIELLPAHYAGAVMIVADEGATFVGLVRREDVARYVEMVEELGNSHVIAAPNLRGLVRPESKRVAPARSKS